MTWCNSLWNKGCKAARKKKTNDSPFPALFGKDQYFRSNWRKRKVRKMVLDPGKLWPLAPKPLTWDQIWQLIPDSPIQRFTKKCEIFALMTSFDLDDVDLVSPDLHHKEVWCGPTHPTSFVFLTFMGTKIAGGRISPLQGAYFSDPLQGTC